MFVPWVIMAYRDILLLGNIYLCVNWHKEKEKCGDAL